MFEIPKEEKVRKFIFSDENGLLAFIVNGETYFNNKRPIQDIYKAMDYLDSLTKNTGE